MKSEYRSMMDKITLSPAARSAIEEQITTAPKSTKRTNHPIRRIAIAAACLMLVVAVAGTPIMAQATEQIQEIISWIADTLNLENVEVSYAPKDSGALFLTGEDQYGNRVDGGYYDGTVSQWLSEENGRLFFTGNGEHIDITDQFTVEKPFTYIYTDEEMVIHYIAVGGVYETDLISNQIGWTEWFQNAPGTEPMVEHSTDGWMGGYAQDAINADTNEEYPWYTAAKEIFDLPWIYR